MTTLPNTGVVLGAIGGDVGTWGTVVNDALSNYDAHNHVTGAGAPIPVAALNINADISFGGLWAPTHLNRITFDAVTPPSDNRSFFIGDGTGGTIAGELYFRNNTGTNIKFTAGTALNVAAFTGGIGGDYTAVSAAVNYVDATKTYTFKQGGGTTWAKVVSGGLRLIEFGSGETVYVEQLCPTALASNYSVTWPTALPAVKGLVQLDSAGAMSTGPALPAVSGVVQISSAGALSTGPTLPAVKGVLLIDNAGALSTGPTLPAAKQLLAIDQAGALSTGTTYQFHAGLCLPQGGATFTFDSSITGFAIWCLQGDSTHELLCPIVAPVGFTLTSWSVLYNKTSAGGTGGIFKLWDYTNVARTQIGATQTVSATGPSFPGQSGLATVITAGHWYAITVVGNNAGTDTITGYTATW